MQVRRGTFFVRANAVAPNRPVGGWGPFNHSALNLSRFLLSKN
jgi:hypothetical protein